jgi:hypothetical protein
MAGHPQGVSPRPSRRLALYCCAELRTAPHRGPSGPITHHLLQAHEPSGWNPQQLYALPRSASPSSAIHRTGGLRAPQPNTQHRLSGGLLSTTCAATLRRSTLRYALLRNPPPGPSGALPITCCRRTSRAGATTQPRLAARCTVTRRDALQRTAPGPFGARSIY